MNVKNQNSRATTFRRLFRFLILGAGGLTLLITLTVVASYVYFRQSLPEVKGGIKAAGLMGPVEIIRDVDAVPHIYAQESPDAYFSLGYVHAQDRLWQMELQRRTGQARLSEVFGPVAASTDRFLRTLGAFRAARNDWNSFPIQPKRVIEAYVAGVNAFISTHSGKGLPPEFTLLRVTPEPWTGPDVLVWIKIMSWRLDSVGYLKELLRSEIVKIVGADRARQLIAGHPGDGSFVSRLGSGAEAFERAISVADEAAMLMGFGSLNSGGLGSNCWAIDSQKSVTGNPILANDVHLETSAPSTWYLAHLATKDFDVIGATIPGLPIVVIGHNRYIAWGVTHLPSDVQDLFLEKLDASGDSVEFRGRFEPVQSVMETINVKGQPDIEHKARTTRHGPIISDVMDANGEHLSSLGPLALRWTALDPADTTIIAFLDLNRATNWGEFRQAVRNIVAPGLNFIYADSKGHIGSNVAGRIPVRSAGNGAFPTEGWSGANEWKGWIPFENLPSVYDPPERFVVSANNRPAPPNYPHFLGDQWSPTYRARRITDLLRAKEKVGLEDTMAIQGDVVSLQARELLPLLLPLVVPQDEDEKNAIEMLSNWDGDTRGDSAPALIYEAWLSRLLRAILEDELGARLMERYENHFDWVSQFLPLVLTNPAGAWCDNLATREKEGCAQIAHKAFSASLRDLKPHLRANIKSWRWDSLHRAVFPHQPLHHVGMLRSFFSRSIPTGGDKSTVNLGSFINGPPFDQYIAAGYRQVIDFSNPDGGRFIYPMGQSGHFLSSKYDNYLTEWQSIRYRPMRMDRASVEKPGATTLRLHP